MFRLATAVALACALASCSTLAKIESGSIKNITAKQVYEIRAGYALARVPMVAYRSLPWCSDHAAPCQTPAIAIQIKRADTTALAALDKLSAFSKAHDVINLGAAYDAAQAAVAAAEQIATTYKLQ